MAKVVLGLDIGGANLKAATSAGRALSVPFKVWQHPEKLSSELRKLIRQFPEADEIAATMTAELCDCYETKREGVRRIIGDLQKAAGKRPTRIWSTEGKFVSTKYAITNYMKVAAANWHGLATWCGRLVPRGHALLVDMGTTTTDLVLLHDGKPQCVGLTDNQRLKSGELWYAGWKRTPAIVFLPHFESAAEHFATTYDACIVMNLIPENASDHDTADGRSATLKHCRSRLARMKCGDSETVNLQDIEFIAWEITYGLMFLLKSSVRRLLTYIFPDVTPSMPLIVSGSGSFIVRAALKLRGKSIDNSKLPIRNKILLDENLGSGLSTVGPAYAAAVLGSEQTE